MALTEISKPSGIQPVGTGKLVYKFQEATVAAKPNYRVQIYLQGYNLSLAVFEFRPDATLLVQCDIAPMLRLALKMSPYTVDRFAQTFVRYQAVWDGGSDAAVYCSLDVIYFYIGSNNNLNSRSKFHIDNCYSKSQKFLYQPSTYFPTSNGRSNYMDWIQRVSNALTFTVTGNAVVTDYGTITKTGGVSAWDSQAYSTQNFVNSCFASWIPEVLGLMIGLNNDPTLDASYTSIDYAIQILDSGLKNLDGSIIYGATIYENSTPTVLVITSPIVLGKSVCRINYDGVNVSYYIDGILYKTTARAVGAALYLDSSFFDLNARASQIEFGPLTRWTTSANITMDSNRQFRKTAGTVAFNEQVYSVESYTTNVYCKGSYLLNLASTDGSVVLVIDAAPTTDATLTTMDYCWYMYYIPASGLIACRMFESNVQVGVQYNVNPWEANVSIVYDGVNVIYYLNGIQVRSVARGVGAALFFDSTFYDLTSGMTNVEFGIIPPNMNFMNFNDGADHVIQTQVFNGEKVQLKSASYSAYTVNGTLTLKQAGTNTVLATIPVIVYNECANPIMLRWLNDLGGLTQYMFDTNQLLSIQPGELARLEKVILYAISVSSEIWFMLNELNKDGIEYGDNLRTGQYVVDATAETNLIPVRPVPTLTSKETRRVGSNFMMSIAYPQLDNISI